MGNDIDILSGHHWWDRRKAGSCLGGRCHARHLLEPPNQAIILPHALQLLTRMHSSRMHTACFNGNLGRCLTRNVHPQTPPGRHPLDPEADTPPAPPRKECIPAECTPHASMVILEVSARGDVCRHPLDPEADPPPPEKNASQQDAYYLLQW